MNWTWKNQSTHIQMVNDECLRLKALDQTKFSPFRGPLDRFRWRATASYFMCWYSMQVRNILATMIIKCKVFSANTFSGWTNAPIWFSDKSMDSGDTVGPSFSRNYANFLSYTPNTKKNIKHFMAKRLKYRGLFLEALRSLCWIPQKVEISVLNYNLFETFILSFRNHLDTWKKIRKYLYMT